MKIQELLPLYAAHPQIKALYRVLTDREISLSAIEGLHASALSMAMASLTEVKKKAELPPILLVMPDEEQAGYLYHDLAQLLGKERALF